MRIYTAARSKKDLGCDQHAQGWSNEIEPKRVPVTGVKCGTKGSRGIHTHPGQRSLECYVDRIESTDKKGRGSCERFVIRREQDRGHQTEGNLELSNKHDTVPVH